MFHRPRLLQLLVALAIAPALTLGCGSKTKTVTVTTPEARVIVSGEFSLLTYATTQLTATTADGTDAGYAWATSDAAIATVDQTGKVTGVLPGPVTITATGQTTLKVGTYNMVVANDIPHLVEWLGSAHAALQTPPFQHWNADGSIPTTCARCHSLGGFRDYLGDDGSAPFVVDAAAPLGTVVNCQACHNATASALSQVTFPSGVTLTGLGPEARCMTCHQGLEATDTVNAQITAAALANDDTVSTALGFKNIHYFAAGATLEAGRVRGAYQYTGQVYDTRFRHVPGYDTCLGCHDVHTLQVKVDGCATCHPEVTGSTYAVKVAGLRAIRMESSLSNDYDGDGNLTEGVAAEIDGLRARLLTAIQGYVTAQALTKICYSGVAYPYFFKDTDGNGTCEAGEAIFPNAYSTWTARLERAAYNYQVSLKDPGAFAHNAKYIIEAIYDAIADIGGAAAATGLVRSDFGHFDGAGQAARHWDTGQAVDATCSRCHAGSEGFKFYLKFGVGTGGIEPDNGLDCMTCHTAFPATAATPNLVAVAKVTFPSGKTVAPDATTGADKLAATSLICMTCHSGLEAKATLDAAIAAGNLGFRNVHYFTAGATLLGAEAQVGYEYAGQTYAGRWSHTGSINCNFCHNGNATKHTFRVNSNLAACVACHGALTSADGIRLTHTADYDGDGSTTESLAAEIQGLQAKVLAQMQAVASGTATPICYAGASYPYFFKDTDGNGTCSAGEAIFPNQFTAWTAPLTKAAFNYQFTLKDPGSWAHNFSYAAELLFDSITDLGGSTAGLTRP